ncbi:MAG: hypothetical protein P8100_13170 [bacterium]
MVGTHIEGMYVDGRGEIVDGPLEITQAEFGDSPQEVGFEGIRPGADGCIELLYGINIVLLLKIPSNA